MVVRKYRKTTVIEGRARNSDELSDIHSEGVYLYHDEGFHSTAEKDEEWCEECEKPACIDVFLKPKSGTGKWHNKIWCHSEYCLAEALNDGHRHLDELNAANKAASKAKM